MKDYTGPNTLLSAFKLIRQAIKSVSFSAGDGLSKVGDTLSVTMPVRGIFTQAEFDALPEAQRNSGLYVIPDGGEGSSGGGFSSAMITYSTDEQRIGTWIDGRPLYRKTFLTTTPSTAGSEQVVVDCQDLRIKKVSGLYGSFYFSADRNVEANINIFWSPSYYSCALYSYSANGISMMVSTASYANCPASITLEYTKTTDEGGAT